MKNLNLSNVQDSSRLPAGGYVLRVKSVMDIFEKEYLKLELDVAEGPYKDYYENLSSRHGFWGLTWYMSYKEKALGLFKSGITAFKASNDGFVWDDDAENDERKLIGCVIGALLREEEYEANDGTVKSNVKFFRAMPASEIRSGNFKIPEKKVLEARNTSNAVVDMTAKPAGFEAVDDEDLPF